MDQLNPIMPISLTEKIIINKKDIEEHMREINKGEAMNENKHINLTISDGTEKQLSNIKENLNLPDDETALKMAITLYSKLVDDRKLGRELRLHEKNGNQYRLEFSKFP